MTGFFRRSIILSYILKTVMRKCLSLQYMSRPMGKPTICIGENKGADQLRGYREADQRLCFRYTDSTIPKLTLFNSKIFSLLPFLVLVQADLCQTCSVATLLVFPQGGSYTAQQTFGMDSMIASRLAQMSRFVGEPTMWFPNRSDTNRPVQAQKIARSLKFRI